MKQLAYVVTFAIIISIINKLTGNFGENTFYNILGFATGMFVWRVDDRYR